MTCKNFLKYFDPVQTHYAMIPGPAQGPTPLPAAVRVSAAIPRLLSALAMRRDVRIIARAHRSPARQDGPLRACRALAG